jgi:hypothetical protein
VGISIEIMRFNPSVAGKNSYFETAQKGLSEKLQPMLKNLHHTIVCSKRLFREEPEFYSFF